MDDVNPRWLVNALPKSGLHMLALMVNAIAEPMVGWWKECDWFGLLIDPWILEWRPEEAAASEWWKLSLLGLGQFIKSHTPYRPDAAQTIARMGLTHVHLIRDLRDVAVSQVYHILSDDVDHLSHGGRDAYADNVGDVLMQVIEGLGPYTGLVERAAAYEGWCDDPHTLTVRYEDIQADREVWAARILEYGLERIEQAWPGIQLMFDRETVPGIAAEMARNSERRDSVFRTGRSGDWRDEFEPRHLDAFERTGGMDWLERRGYA